jgi:DNA-binding NarL/FixJ family response regulator
LLAATTERLATARRQVDFDVSAVVVRLALRQVAEAGGWTSLPASEIEPFRVSDRLPGSDDNAVDVFVADDRPAACQDAIELVLTGRARSLILGSDPEALDLTLEALERGSTLIPRRVIDLALAAPMLTERHRHILRQLASGRSSRGIGVTLNQSESTVKRDIAELLQLFGADNRTALVNAAAEMGFIRLRSSDF